LKKSRVVKWDPDVTHEGWSHVVTHRTEMELQFVRLSENGIDEYWLLCFWRVRRWKLKKTGPQDWAMVLKVDFSFWLYYIVDSTNKSGWDWAHASRHLARSRRLLA
jgi:hypothetical protein